MEFKKFEFSDYELLCSFLIELNKGDKVHINCNWARLEWMIGHPEFDHSLINLIGLWTKDNRVVATAIYDTYLGEASVLALKEYEYLYEELLDYAYQYLKDDNGLGIAVNDKDENLINLVKEKGYLLYPQKEVLMKMNINHIFEYQLPPNITLKSINPYEGEEAISWVFYQGFDHGNNYDEFKKELSFGHYHRPHVNQELNIVAVNAKGEYVGFCSVWYDMRTTYAYLEPLCVIPSCRKQGIARALIYELMNRVKNMGAKEIYVISDKDFYKNAGFLLDQTYSFYFVDKIETVNGKSYKLLKLLGKGKGGYSYLAQDENNKEVVLKKIHHEPCDYYTFGNKIEAEINDYQRLINAKIRIPKMIDVDKEKEIIIKEYIEGEVISDLTNKEKYIPQVVEMAHQAKEKGLNIDYYPTNFVVRNELLYYIDYECNEYMDEWSFDNWGSKYWH